MSMEERSGRLASIHNLKIDHTNNMKHSVYRPSQDLLGSCRDAIVEGEEHLRLVDDGCSDTLVNLSTGLEESSDILFQQPCSISIVKRRKDGCRHYD